jgi:hypothetical protein
MKSVWSIDSTSLQFMLKMMVCTLTRFFLQSFLLCLFWFCWNWYNMVTYKGLLWSFLWNFIDLYDQMRVTCQYPNVEDLQVVQLTLLKDFQTQIWVSCQRYFNMEAFLMNVQLSQRSYFGTVRFRNWLLQVYLLSISGFSCRIVHGHLMFLLWRAFLFWVSRCCC